MLSIKVVVQSFFDRIEKAAKRAGFRNFGHAAASIRRDAISTIEQAEGASAPGTPPHTHKGRQLARSVRFFANDRGAVIGPVASMVGTSGTAQEFGGQYKGEEYPARPFMGPALSRAVPRIGGDWAGSVIGSG